MYSCRKITLETGQTFKQEELETYAESVRSTLKNVADFFVFSTTANDTKIIYLSSLAFEHCTVLIEKLGLASTECSSTDLNVLSGLLKKK